MKFLLILLIPVCVFAAIDSTAIVDTLKKWIPEDFAIMVFGCLTVIVPVIYRLLAEWACNRKTTWYWNKTTQKFVLGRTSSLLSKVFGRGVNDCSVQYAPMPEEAKEALAERALKTVDVETMRKLIEKKYPNSLGK